ncbi:uncharacterized protein [Lepeophtheirus salmonis]|uniref:uncharacterized protein isoform X1 n=1 Tax=Lepeophtheirus salmonis TaxID=72036 RepID=UPI001AE4D27C|nr:uncharacterized protein LOC121129355 isoform X1 [Lepeophtheirus salmonis]
MAEFNSGRRVFVLLLGSITASIFIICFLNWEAHRRYDRYLHHNNPEGESITIIKERKETNNSSSTTLITVIRSKMSHFISSIKTKLRKKLLYLIREEESKENTDVPEEADNIPHRIGRQLKSISEEDEHDDIKTKEHHSHSHNHLEEHLILNEIHNKTTRHLTTKIHQLKRDSPLVRGILRSFGHKCNPHDKHHGNHTHRHHGKHHTHHHHGRNHTDHPHDMILYIGIKSHSNHSSHRHIIPQAAYQDVTHSDKSILQGHNVCGSTADVVLIIISTTLINWTIFIIVFVIRAIFLQRNLLCNDDEEDTLPITIYEDQYKRLYEDSTDSIIIKPNTRTT